MALTTEELVSLSSGCVADETITKDLMEAKERGKEALTSFVQDSYQEALLDSSTPSPN